MIQMIALAYALDREQMRSRLAIQLSTACALKLSALRHLDAHCSRRREASRVTVCTYTVCDLGAELLAHIS